MCVQMEVICLVSLDTLATPQCQQDAIPFICLYGFPICSQLEREVYLPTKEECERITTTTCRVEFNLALSFGFGDLLPKCNLLPSSSESSG